MNISNSITKLNQKELSQNVPQSASWHLEYSSTSYVKISSLPYSLTEEDILKIFSQYGIPTHLYLLKDRETKKSRGIAFLKYEDWKSCVLAIDNFNGIKVIDKYLTIDHIYFKLGDNDREEDFEVDYGSDNELVGEHLRLEESKSGKDYEFEDPMASFIGQSKQKDSQSKRRDDRDDYDRERYHRHKSKRSRTERDRRDPVSNEKGDRRPSERYENERNERYSGTGSRNRDGNERNYRMYHSRDKEAKVRKTDSYEERY